MMKRMNNIIAFVDFFEHFDFTNCTTNQTAIWVYRRTAINYHTNATREQAQHVTNSSDMIESKNHKLLNNQPAQFSQAGQSRGDCER
jgi:hypothetical protein